jgi:adenine-specific DNA-methyltransferase
MFLDHADQIRRDVSPTISQDTKSALGQFMTPAPVARFMAAMFPPSDLSTCKVLDAGAGMGALTCAFLDRWSSGGFGFSRVESTAHEFDDNLRQHLTSTLAKYAEIDGLTSRVVAGDFIMQTALALLEDKALPHFTHATLNPPYKKINNGGLHRRALSQVGIETVNLYTGFLALAIELMAQGGVVVAIVPRSFCNGTYYKPFRELLLAKTAILGIHLFDSRSKAFSDDDVLQENIIIMLERGAVQGPITVTTSTDDNFTDLTTRVHPFERIVFPRDAERFIHVPTSANPSELELSDGVRFTLDDIGIRVSTGPVVDFRLKEHLRDLPEAGSVPILYPMHFTDAGTVWPVVGGKKANAIMVNDETRGWLMPNGFYCVVRRFSSKEERRRIVARVVRPDSFPEGTDALGLENHINVFNEKRHGLPEELAYGLATYMNTSAVDEAFRRFSGHTQVNAGDLKAMRYPSRSSLVELGQWARRNPNADQTAIDGKFKELNP